MDDRSGTWTGAAVILIVKAVLGGWAGFALLVASRRHHRRFLNATITRQHTGIGLLILMMVAAAIVVAIALLRRLAWASVAAYAVEAVAIFAAITRIGETPGLSLLSIGLSVAVIALVAVGSPKLRPNGPTPA